MSNFFRLALCVSVLALPSAMAAGISGIWSGQLVDRNGDPQDLSFRFIQSGDALTGKMYGDNESTLIADGRVSGDQITFSVTSELNGQISKFVYTCTLKGDEMELTRERTGTKNAPLATPAAAAKGQSDKQIIRLKRIA